MHPVGLKCEPKVSYQTLITKTLPERPNSRLGGFPERSLDALETEDTSASMSMVSSVDSG